MVSLPYFINNKLKIEFKVFFIFFKKCCYCYYNNEMCMVIFLMKTNLHLFVFSSNKVNFDLCIVDTKSEAI